MKTINKNNNKMKNIKLAYIWVLLGLLIMSGCEDVLDTKASDAFAEDLIYSDPAQVERVVYPIYNSTESWSLNKFQWWSRRFNIEIGSLEARFNFQDNDLLRLRTGWTPSNTGVLQEKWKNYWDYVRMANEFLDKIDDSEAMQKDPKKVEGLKAEVKFLRANLYTKLLKYYGGVPIMENALGLNDDFNLVRNSYEEVVEFIVKELDEAIAILPDTRPASEYGRATKLAALAVKSRTLLYAASKLHDVNSLPSGPLYDYKKSTKWEDAASAAKAIIDIVGARDLIQVTNAVDYQKLFLSNNQDILFARPYSSDYYEFAVDANSLPDLTQSPSGYGGWGMSSVTHNFALLFNMEDGSSTKEGKYDPANPNKNREMRYYANLFFNGAQYRGRDVQYYLSEDVDTYPHGLDSPKGLGNQAHSSKTGYNIRKFLNESVGLTETSPERPYILYRLAEIYLNYAEAKYHLGDEDTAREFASKVSTRALQPAITSSGVELLEDIKNERRIELAFEGHNFFDERRWMNEDNLGFDLKGLKWTRKADGTLSNQIYTVENRPWFKKMYYLPIPESEVEKAPSLEQNYGYDD